MINVICLNYPDSTTTLPWSTEKLSFMKLVLGAKKMGGHCSREKGATEEEDRKERSVSVGKVYSQHMFTMKHL